MPVIVNNFGNVPAAAQSARAVAATRWISALTRAVEEIGNHDDGVGDRLGDGAVGGVDSSGDPDPPGSRQRDAVAQPAAHQGPSRLGVADAPADTRRDADATQQLLYQVGYRMQGEKDPLFLRKRSGDRREAGERVRGGQNDPRGGTP